MVSSHLDRSRSSDLMSVKLSDSIGITHLLPEQDEKIAMELLQEKAKRQYFEKMFYEMVIIIIVNKKSAT